MQPALKSETWKTAWAEATVATERMAKSCILVAFKVCVLLVGVGCEGVIGADDSLCVCLW
jgi:hypothetical protein